MAIIKSVRDIDPKWGKNCFMADNAVIAGEVSIGDNCSFWFGSVTRGDVNSITIGNNTNIQDGAIIHCTYQKAKTLIGNNVSIGHNAIVHGCTIEDNVLIGMGAIIMDHAHIKSGSVIAAGAVILQETIVRSGVIFAGVPAKEVKEVEGDLTDVFERTSKNYILYSKWYK